ncbi:putative disease resistance protein RGA3 [Macadamia integrifolia]|uniref:putative disease resistance protein RGA3 n=1 Tax=Macadamia integrifolia TaxID=60698 RepID=UPI001C4E9B3F|nr:putative disease resistance protein RGA3 [Macadamia integrifolia]
MEIFGSVLLLVPCFPPVSATFPQPSRSLEAFATVGGGPIQARKQGFLGLDGRKELELIGVECFNNLVMRSFFHDLRKDKDGHIYYCKMHDLVHDLAQFITDKECFLIEMKSNNDGDQLHNNKKFRYLSLVSGEEAMNSIPTLSELCNLQTLKLDNCEYLSKLPQGIGKLINLRHLEIENTVCLNCLPQEIRRLTSLRTLNRFFASEGCKIGELKNLNLLQGSLEITRLKRVENKSESYEAGLKNKQDVRSLVLEFSDDSLGGVKEVERMEDVLQGLEPHPNLEKLSIYEYPGFKLPSWMSDNSVLSNLQSLSLSCCWKLRQLPPTLWKLPFLEIIEIDLLPNWEEWTMGVEEDGVIISTTILPCLRNLVISSCPKLKTLPALGKLASLESIKIEGLQGLTHWDEWELGVDGKEIKIMPCLRILKLYKCPNLSVVLATGVLVSLEQLSVHSSRKIKYIGELCEGGGSDGNDLFPELESLEFGGMENLEECETRRTIIKHRQIMPCLRSLVLWHCPMLVAPPHHLFLLPHISPPLLRKLVIGDSPFLSWMQQPPLPPSSYVLLPFLEELELLYNAGSLSRSLLSPDNSQMWFLNLKSLILTGSPHTSLPQGIGQLTMLQRLTIRSWNRMTYMSEEIQHMAMLRELRILCCEILGPRCQEGAADWGKISYIPSIIVGGIFVEHQ